MSSRGSRGGRGRGRRPASERDEGKLEDPRIAGRRPSAQKAAAASEAAKTEPKAEEKDEAKQASGEKSEEKKPATRRRRRSTASRSASADTKSTSTSTSTGSTAAAEPRDTASRAAGTRGEAEDVALADEMRALREAIVAQSEAIDSLRESHARAARRLRLGVFVDVPNIIYGAERDNGGSGARVDMGKLLAYLSAGRELIRATAYAPVSDDPNEPVEQQRFVSPFVRHDYRIVTKPMKRFADGSIKGNFDVEMALDMVTMADRLDVVAVVSGDADFARAVELLQTQGVRVEVVAFSGSTSVEMRALADHYVEVGSILDEVKV